MLWILNIIPRWYTWMLFCKRGFIFTTRTERSRNFSEKKSFVCTPRCLVAAKDPLRWARREKRLGRSAWICYIWQSVRLILHPATYQRETKRESIFGPFIVILATFRTRKVSTPTAGSSPRDCSRLQRSSFTTRMRMCHSHSDRPIALGRISHCRKCVL